MEVLEETSSMEELKKFERAYYDELNSKGFASPKTRFEYAWALIRSRHTADLRKGILLLEELCSSGDPEARRDYLYYLAVANTKVKEYDRAMDCIKKFLSVEPNNRQAQELEKIIKDKMTKEGLKGLAVAGGAAIAIGGIIGLGMALARK